MNPFIRRMVEDMHAGTFRPAYTKSPRQVFAPTGQPYVSLGLKQAKAASGFADILARSRLRGNAGVAWGFG
jgi:hypothetical protein